MKYKIAIIGAGPGGYVAAIRAAQLGASVVLIEKENVGGTCLNWGCIPSKAVLASVDRYNQAKKFAKFGINIENLSFDYSKISERKWNVVEKIRKNLTQLIKSYNIDIIEGQAEITSQNSLIVRKASDPIDIEFEQLILATGSRPISLPGLEIDHKFILDTNDILSLEQLPDSVLIVGSGASGIEWARIFSSFGKQVTIVEIAPNLAPMFDKTVSERIERIFKRNKVEYFVSTGISEIRNRTVALSNGKEISPDIVFLAAGRSPNSDISGLEELGIQKSRHYIAVDQNMQTNIPNIYAIGDVTGILQLAHVASHQGLKAIEHILLNKTAKINYNAAPKIIYGNPEVGAVGFTEQELIQNGVEFKTSLFPISAVGKAMVEDEIEGMVKVLSHDNKILGVHILSEDASSMIQQAAIAINSGLSVEEFKECIFAHPTLSEALHEAFLGLDNEALHLPKTRV